MKIQIPKYEATFEGHLKAVFSNDMLWDWRTTIPKEEKEQLFISIRIMEGRKEITRNPEAYSSSIREMLRFIRNIIVHRTDHKFKTLDKVYNKIDNWLPGLLQSWRATEAKIYNIDTSRRNGNATNILVDLKEQWHQLKGAKEEKINIFSNYYSRLLWFPKYKHIKAVKNMIKKHKINTYKNEIPRIKKQRLVTAI